MSLVRVYIATTAGPVAIQRITEEDADVNSVICLAGKAVALPISGAYDAFVRNPTGVVQRHFGHAAFRIDVSEKIDEGYSWQFGVFTAHALQRAARLAGPKDSAETIVVATGELDRDLTLHVVDGVAEKIARLHAVLAALAGDAAKLVIAVPAETDQPWRETFASVRLPTGTDVQIVAAAQADDLLGHLGIQLPVREASPSQTAQAAQPTQSAQAPTGPSRRRGRVLVLAALLALAAMAAAAGGAVYAPEIKSWVAELTAPPPLPTAEPAKALLPKPVAAAATPSPEPKPGPKPEVKPEPKQETKPKAVPEPPAAPKAEPVSAVGEVDQIPSKPVPPRKPTVAEGPEHESDRIEEARLPDIKSSDVKVTIQELRAPPGRSCADVRAGHVQPVRTSAAKRDTDHFRPSLHRNLCTVEIMAAGADSDTFLFGRYQRWTRNRPDREVPDKVIDLGPRRDGLRWTVDIPDRLRRGAVFRVVVFSTRREFSPSRRVLERFDRMDPRSERMQSLIARLKRRGIQVTLSQFRVVPERIKRNRRAAPGSYPPPPR